MARLDQEGLVQKAIELFEGAPDPTGTVDVIGEKGSVIVVSDPKDLKAAFKRLRKVPGYRWILLHRDDLFLANNMSVGSKAGIMDESGNVLKAAALPR